MWPVVGETTMGGMNPQSAVIWTADGEDRFVGKLAISEQEVVLDGTTTTSARRHGRVRIPRAAILAATAERVGDVTAIRIELAAGVYLVELLSGSRGSALSLARQLST